MHIAHTHTAVLQPFFWDYLGELVPGEVFCGPIHRHCPKIYLKTCHKIIL